MADRPRQRETPAPVETIEPTGGMAEAPAPDLREEIAADEEDRLQSPPQAPPGAPGEIRKGKLAGLSMPAAIWVLSWPILAESFLQSLVGLVDTALAAGLSEAATDAIGGAAYIIWALNLLGYSVGIGATSLVSRSLGRGRQAVANAAVGQAMLLALIAGSAMGAMLAILTPQIAEWLNLSPEATEAIKPYLYLLAPGTPMVAIVFSGLACQRGAGDSKRPLVIMLIINLVNIAVSWWTSGIEVFGLPNPSPMELGVVGIAIGTLGSWTLGAVLTVAWLAGGQSGVKLRRKRLLPHWHTMRRLIRVGLPNFFESAGMWAGNFIVLLYVGWLATSGLMGSHVIAIRVESLSFLPGFAMGIAAGTLAGQYLGAGNIAKAKRAILLCAAIAAGGMGLFGVAFLAFNEEIVAIFSEQAIHQEKVPPIIFLAGFIQIPFGVMLVLRNALRGAGDTRTVMFITWGSTFLIRLPLAWFFSGVDVPLPGGGSIPNPGPDWGLWGLWVGLVTELTIRSLLFLGRFLQGGWQTIKV